MRTCGCVGRERRRERKREGESLRDRERGIKSWSSVGREKGRERKREGEGEGGESEGQRERGRDKELAGPIFG